MDKFKAKMKVTEVARNEHGENLTMKPVCGNNSGGRDEDNTYSKYTPTGVLTLTVTNPEIIGKINPGDVYYLDFTKVEDPKLPGV